MRKSSESWRIRSLHQLLAQRLVLIGELAREVLERVLAPLVRHAACFASSATSDQLSLRFVEILLERGIALRPKAEIAASLFWMIFGIGMFAIFCARSYWMSPKRTFAAIDASSTPY